LLHLLHDPNDKGISPEDIKNPIIYSINDEGCFIMYGGTTADMGYRRITKQGKQEFAHRYVYRIYNGEIPPHYVVRHTCHNPKCVNPAHLKVGTHKQNMEDKAKRDIFKGEGSCQAKLNDEKAREIYLSTDSVTNLANKYGVGRSTVQSIRSDKSWTHVTAELTRPATVNKGGKIWHKNYVRK
jgi:hypothetical protein